MTPPTAGMDPLQRKIVQFMPIGFSVMFAFFPAGLVLYWATNAGLSLAQQWMSTVGGFLVDRTYPRFDQQAVYGLPVGDLREHSGSDGLPSYVGCIIWRNVIPSTA